MSAPTPRMARPIEVLHQPGLTGAQRETRMSLAEAVEDLQRALKFEPGLGLDQAALRLLDAMAWADDADARAARQAAR